MKKLKITKTLKFFKTWISDKYFKINPNFSDTSRSNNKAMYGPIKLKLKMSIIEDNKNKTTIKNTLFLLSPNKKNTCFKRLNIADNKYYCFIIIINYKKKI